MAVVALTKDNFDEVVMKSEKPVLIDFYADWCAPCKMMSPVVEAIAEEYEAEYTVCKVNVDEEAGLALKYQVMSIPTFVTMNLGMFAERFTGGTTKESLLEMLKKAGEKKDFSTN